jgi:hypothetical protein
VFRCRRQSGRSYRERPRGGNGLYELPGRRGVQGDPDRARLRDGAEELRDGAEELRDAAHFD